MHIETAFEKKQRAGRLGGSQSQKLTELQARSIKFNYPDKSLAEVAKLYDVDRSTISRIKNGKTWEWLQK